MQLRQRFVSDQRYDLNQLDAQMQYVADEFYKYNQQFICAENRIIKGWEVAASGGLDIEVDNSLGSLLINSESIGPTGATGTQGYPALVEDTDVHTLAMVDNAVNYIEIDLSTDTTGEQTVAIWDATAGDGSETTADVDVVALMSYPTLVGNTGAFVNTPNRIPIARVTATSGSLVVEDVREMFFEHASDWDFGVTGGDFGVTGSDRSDRKIYDLKSDLDAIKTCIREMKGLTSWYTNQGVTTLDLLKRLNYMIVDGGVIDWAAPLLTWSAPFKIIVPGKDYTYEIPANTQGITANYLAYVTLPAEGTTGDTGLAMSVVAPEEFVIDEENVRNYIVAYRSGNIIYVGNGWQSVELEDGESGSLGDGLSQQTLTALGLTDEIDSDPPYYNVPGGITGSCFAIIQGTPMVNAISELDYACRFLNDMIAAPIYDEYLVSDGGTGYATGADVHLPPSRFAATGATTHSYIIGFNQLEVEFNGRKMTNGAGEDYVEQSGASGGVGNHITLNYALLADTKIGFRIQTGGGPAMGFTGITGPTGSTGIAGTTGATGSEPQATFLATTGATGGASETIDFDNGTIQKLVLMSNTAITLSATAAVGSFLLMLKQGTTGCTGAFGTTVNWPGGTEPTLSTSLDAIDIVTLAKADGAWYGMFNLDFK